MAQSQHKYHKTHELTSFVFLSNQCVISFPAASMMGFRRTSPEISRNLQSFVTEKLHFLLSIVYCNQYVFTRGLLKCDCQTPLHVTPVLISVSVSIDLEFQFKNAWVSHWLKNFLQSPPNPNNHKKQLTIIVKSKAFSVYTHVMLRWIHFNAIFFRCFAST